MLWGERRENDIIVAATKPTGCPMPQPTDLSRSPAALDENSTLIAVIEMSQSSWLVAAIIPGVERQPTKKLIPDERALLRLLHRWRGEAEKSGCNLEQIAVAYEAGRDGFWWPPTGQARGLKAHGCRRTASKPM
jgi:transposase